MADDSGSIVSSPGSDGAMVKLGAHVQDWQLLHPTNLTNNAAFAALSTFGVYRPTPALPMPQNVPASGRILINPRGCSTIRLAFFGEGADNETGDYRLIEWNLLRSTRGGRRGCLWVPSPLAVGAFTVSTQVGLANAIVGATERFADAITVTDDRSAGAIGARVRGPAAADNTIVDLVIDVTAGALLEVQGRRNTLATSWNAIYRGL